MRKQISIKEIARMAGVSAGTVDRVIHNRGKVSRKSQIAVEEILSQVGYRSNIHASAISLKKGFKILFSIPSSHEGEYWYHMEQGFTHALNEYSDIRISTEYCFYDQFDVFSCKEAFSQIIDKKPDGVIIGPTFKKETKELCNSLDAASIPYVFVDTCTDDTNPVATFSTDNKACGRLVGTLLFNIIGKKGKIALFSIKRRGNRHSDNSGHREKGLAEYAKEIRRKDSILKISIPMAKSQKRDSQVVDFLKQNKDVRGAVVMNSRGHIIADILKENHIRNVKIVSFDLTDNNRKRLSEEGIFALLCQRPQLQGYRAVEKIIRYLLYNTPEANPHQILPIDIVMKENLPFYQEVIEK